MSNDRGPVPGWHGKMPALGDFASRRLPPEFISRWDEWLQHGIAASRAALGDQWLDIYLNSPIWRFVLWPGVCGEIPWAGVLMPSVDNVGRYFPLTVAVALTPEFDMTAVFEAHDWYTALEDVALSALRLDGSIDELEEALAQYPFPSDPVPACAQATLVSSLVQWWQTPVAEPLALALEDGTAVRQLMSTTARRMFAEAGHGRSLWWSWGREVGGGSLHCCAGLPSPEYLAVLLRDGTQLDRDLASWPSTFKEC